MSKQRFRVTFEIEFERVLKVNDEYVADFVTDTMLDQADGDGISSFTNCKATELNVGERSHYVR